MKLSSPKSSREIKRYTHNIADACLVCALLFEDVPRASQRTRANHERTCDNGIYHSSGLSPMHTKPVSGE